MNLAQNKHLAFYPGNIRLRVRLLQEGCYEAPAKQNNQAYNLGE